MSGRSEFKMHPDRIGTSESPAIDKEQTPVALSTSARVRNSSSMGVTFNTTSTHPSRPFAHFIF
jgi:hypothetical protein